MNITELIATLETLRDEYGDISVHTEDYGGGDYDLNEPTPSVREEHPDAMGPTVILNG